MGWHFLQYRGPCGGRSIMHILLCLTPHGVDVVYDPWGWQNATSLWLAHGVDNMSDPWVRTFLLLSVNPPCGDEFLYHFQSTHGRYVLSTPWACKHRCYGNVIDVTLSRRQFRYSPVITPLASTRVWFIVSRVACCYDFDKLSVYNGQWCRIRPCHLTSHHKYVTMRVCSNDLAW